MSSERNNKKQKLISMKSLKNVLRDFDKSEKEKQSNMKMYERWNKEFHEVGKTKEYKKDIELIDKIIEILKLQELQEIQRIYSLDISYKDKRSKIKKIEEKYRIKIDHLFIPADYKGVRTVLDLKEFTDLFGSKTSKKRTSKKRTSKKRTSKKRTSKKRTSNRK